ncbi:MAG: DUF167 domain-containing protein [Porticoccaceae bacterium]|nr:DUF167 domain-containing protein [Porticoccaceae bacterium]
MPHYRWQEDTLLIYCHIQANARHNGFSGLSDGLSDESLKIRVSAAATEGAANKCLIKYLATQFGVPKSSIELLRGQTNRYKTIAIKAPKKIPEQSLIPQI